MSDEDRRCGTCRHVDDSQPYRLLCAHPLAFAGNIPACVFTYRVERDVYLNPVTNCPCWATKESDDAK